MVNFQVTDDGGIQDVDFRWAKSVKQVRLSHFIPMYFGQQKDGVNINEKNITSQIHAETGIAFIPWCHGRVIRGHGKGVLVKFDGFKYL